MCFNTLFDEKNGERGNLKCKKSVYARLLDLVVSASGRGVSEEVITANMNNSNLRLVGVKDARVLAHDVKPKPLALYSHDISAGVARPSAGLPEVFPLHLFFPHILPHCVADQSNSAQPR